jgi:hypothetical protein
MTKIFGNTCCFSLQTYSYPLKVFIIGGQSNADGRGNNAALPSALLGKQWGRWIYYKPTVNQLPNGEWQILEAGVNNLNPLQTPTGTSGVELSFMENMFDFFQEDIYLIKYGQGSTCIADVGGVFDPNVISTSDCWLPTGNELITRSLSWFVTPALQDLKDRGIPYEVVGVIWYQGECDSLNVTYASNYQTNMSALMTAFETHPLINNPNLIWIDFEVKTESIHLATINTAKQNLQALYPTRYKYMSTAAYTYEDTAHLDMVSYIQAGNDAASELRTLM